jgi:hypothetical protein
MLKDLSDDAPGLAGFILIYLLHVFTSVFARLFFLGHHSFGVLSGVQNRG